MGFLGMGDTPHQRSRCRYKTFSRWGGDQQKIINLPAVGRGWGDACFQPVIDWRWFLEHAWFYQASDA